MKKFFSGIQMKHLLYVAGAVAVYFGIKSVAKFFGGKASAQDKAENEEWKENQPKNWSDLTKTTGALDQIVLQVETELMSIVPSGGDIAEMLQGLSRGDLTYIYWKFGQKPHTVFGFNRKMTDLFGWINNECIWGKGKIEAIYNFEPLKFVAA